MFKYHGCDIRWQTPDHQPVTLPAENNKAETWGKSGMPVGTHNFLAFVTVSHIVFLLKIAFIFYPNLSRICGWWQAVLKIKNKNKDSGEILKCIL